MIMQSSESSFLTIKEVAEKLRISLATVHRYLKTNKLKSILLGNRRLISLEQLNDFLNTEGVNTAERN